MTDFQSVLITGASSGIGSSLAKLYAQRGARVVLAARREQALRELADAIISEGGQASVRVLDVSDPEAAEAIVLELDDEHRFDLVVANAGVGKERHGSKLRWDDCRQVVMVNVCGAVATLTGAIPGMVARGRGHLVGISSIAQYRGLPKNAAYSASKAFLSTFLESLRIDLHGQGIAVTDVRPGFVDTPMTATIEQKPFEVGAGEAAEIIARAVDRRRGVITFPKPMAVLGHVLDRMPGFIYEPAVRGRGGRSK